MKKKCAVFHGPGREFEVREFEVAQPAENMVGAETGFKRNLRDGCAYPSGISENAGFPAGSRA